MTAQPGERLSNESAAAFSAFVIYRDLAAERSTAEVARRCGKHKSLIDRWSSRHDWVVRASQYDEHIDAERRRSQIEEVRKMAERHAQEAMTIQRAALEPALEVLRQLQENGRAFAGVPPQELMRLARAGGYLWAAVARFERLARGVAEERVEIATSDGESMSLESAKRALAPILGVAPDQVVDELATRRRLQREAERAERKNQG